MVYHTVVIGAGPAGLMAAIQAAEGGRVLVLEKLERPGARLLASGGGMCNYTRSHSIKEFLPAYGEKGRFLRKALYHFNNEMLMTYFKQRGYVPTIREDGKVFSGTLQASDLLSILLSDCREKGIDVQCQSPVKQLQSEAAGFTVHTDKEVISARSVVLASGGKARAVLGGGSDGLRLAHALGHRIVPPRPALSPVRIKQWSGSDLAGQSFAQVPIRVMRGGREALKLCGDLLITHEGLSGPAILNLSGGLKADDRLIINTLSISAEQCAGTIQALLRASPKKTLGNILQELPLPKRFILKQIEASGLQRDLQGAQVSKSMVNTLSRLFCEWELEIDAIEGYNKAMAMAGGIDTAQIDPATMQSTLIRGLFFAGEVIDIVGYTGGYNIQAAFSTGYLAGRHTAEA